MHRLTISTERLMLILDTPEELLTRVEQMSPADRAEVSPDWLARVRGNDASTRVLTKCGFAFIGEVIDPEDGLVLRWERKR